MLKCSQKEFYMNTHKNTAFRIEGGIPLSGEISAKGNKNSALPILASCAMVNGVIVLENVPRIEDVLSMIELLESLGVSTDWREESTLAVDSSSLSKGKIDPDLAAKIRGSVLVAAPLLQRRGEAVIPIPGGDRIGRRRLDTHLQVFHALGVQFEAKPTEIVFKMINGGFKGNQVWLDEASVTGTEQAIMAAVLAEGETVISNAASEPHVQDLCRFLCGCGASIEGVGSNTLRITGVPFLESKEAFALGSDFMEECSLIAATLVTKGKIILEGHAWENHHMMRVMLRKLGCDLENIGGKVLVDGTGALAVRTEADKQMPAIKSAVWPGFNTDLMSALVVIATQSKGKVLFHETLFNNRFVWTDTLQRMGADILLCDPHRIMVTGCTPLHPVAGGIESPDIRAGMALLVAALATPGTHIVRNGYQIDRGYERIDERLRSLGANIQRIEA